MWNARSRKVAGKTSGRRAPVAEARYGDYRPGLIETLEGRCLLSAAAVDARGAVETISRAPASAMTLTANDTGYSRAEFDATGTFTGELTLRRRNPQGFKSLIVTLDVTSQDDFGNVDGTFRGVNPGTFGVATFRDGVVNNTRNGSRGWVHNFDARWVEGQGSDGLLVDGKMVRFDGHFNENNLDQVQGVLRDHRNRRIGNFTLNRTSVSNPPPNPTNTAPVANDDTFDTDVGEPLRLTQAAMLGNDSDADNDALTITSVGAATNGTVVLNSDSTITFTPDSAIDPAVGGTGSFTYTVSDGTDTDSATVNITVTPNDPNAPTAGVDTATTDENTAITFTQGDLLANDSGAQVGDEIAVVAVGEATNGTVSISADFSTITFTPADGFDGIASFSYTLGIDSDPALTDEGHVFVTVNDTGNGGGGGVGNGGPRPDDGGGAGNGNGTGGNGAPTPSVTQVVGAESLVGTYEGTLRLTARSTDASATGRNRDITISIDSHAVNGAVSGSIEVFGLLFDANGDGVVDSGDDADGDGNGDLTFTGFVNEDRFALVLRGALGGGVVNGNVQPDHHLFGELLFQAGNVIADGEFDAIRVSTSPRDPSPPLVDPNAPTNPDAPDSDGTPGGPNGTPNGPDSDPGPGTGSDPGSDGTDPDGTGTDGGDGGAGGSGDPVVGPGSADEGPGTPGSGPAPAGGDGIGEGGEPSDGIGGGGSNPDDDTVGTGGGGPGNSFSNARRGGDSSPFGDVGIVGLGDDQED